MSLSTMLLADSVKVNKGGPGSGPQGGMSKGKAKMSLTNASRKADQASHTALGNSTQANHIDAVDAHLNAASIARRAGNARLASYHADQANYHPDVSTSFRP